MMLSEEATEITIGEVVYRVNLYRDFASFVLVPQEITGDPEQVLQFKTPRGKTRRTRFKNAMIPV